MDDVSIGCGELWAGKQHFFFLSLPNSLLIVLVKCLLTGDEMGLGKTLQALAVACAFREDWPVLVVAPSSLKANWKKEAKKWVPGLTEESIQVKIPPAGAYMRSFCPGELVLVFAALMVVRSCDTTVAAALAFAAERFCRCRWR